MTSATEILGYFERMSNWGRWGDDDQRGTLNLINAASRRSGAQAVRHGVSVSCAWDVEAGPGGTQRATFAVAYMTPAGAGDAPPDDLGDHRWGVAAETLTVAFHGGAYTHLDSPAHMFWDARMYNGRPAELVGAVDGATWGAVTAAADGLVTRGVLLDIPAARGVDWLEPGQAVRPADLEAAETRQQVKVAPGDAVLLRTGYGRYRRATGHVWDPADLTQAGWHASCLPWLHERDVAYIGADTSNDVMPSGVDGVFMPIHSVGLVAMGLWLIDNCDLEACAATAAQLSQWDFLLSVAPLRFAGVTGSPVNPIATF